MLWEILWLDSGETVIRGTGMYIYYNCATLNWTLFFDNVF